MNNSPKRAWVEGNSIFQSSGNSLSQNSAADLIEIWATSVQKVIYEENFIILRFRDGSQISVGELDDGFPELVASLRDRLEGFSDEWMAELNAGDYTERLIWKSYQP